MFDLFDFQPVDHDPFSEAKGGKFSPRTTQDPPPQMMGEPSPTPSKLSPSIKNPILQQMNDYYDYLVARRIPPEVAARMTTRPMQEEWEAQRLQHDIGEPLNLPPNYVDPHSGARNLWDAFRTRNWEPQQYWSLPIDRINALGGGEEPPEENEQPLHPIRPGGTLGGLEEAHQLGRPISPGLPRPDLGTPEFSKWEAEMAEINKAAIRERYGMPPPATEEQREAVARMLRNTSGKLGADLAIYKEPMVESSLLNSLYIPSRKISKFPANENRPEVIPNDPWGWNGYGQNALEFLRSTHERAGDSKAVETLDTIRHLGPLGVSRLVREDRIPESDPYLARLYSDILYSHNREGGIHE